MPVPVLGKKPWYKSKAIRGGAIAIVAGALGLSTGDVEQTAELLTQLASIIGGALSIYGRVTATQKLSVK